MGHRCERLQLFMVEDSLESKAGDSDKTETVKETKEVVPKILFHAITGTIHPQTIRVSGKMKNKDLTVLINGKNTHNFIDQSIISKFRLPVIQSKRFKLWSE